VNAEERAKDIETDLLREMWKPKHDSLNGQQLREGPFRAVLVQHIRAAARGAMERCLAIAEEYPETPEVARDIRALIEQGKA